jgi:hypothetical protein
VDAEDFKTTGGVRDTNVDFTIETTETSKSGVDRVRPIGSSHHDDIRTGLDTVHESEELGDDTTLDFTICLRNQISEYGIREMHTIHTFSRFGAIESISSMKMIAGLFFSASSNAFLKLLSLSPAILLMISGPLIKKKKAPVSFATARAMSVLPVPGGPYIRMPRGGLIPIDLKS